MIRREGQNYRWYAAVTTAPRQPSFLNDTLASLAAAGWPEVKIFDDRPRDDGSQLGPWPNLLQALSSLAANVWLDEAAGKIVDGDFKNVRLAVFQDDIKVPAGLRCQLDHKGVPDDGISSLFTPSAVCTGTGSGWMTPPRMPRSYGAQALIFPAYIAQLLLSNPPCPGRRFPSDFLVAKFCDEAKIPYYLHEPSLVIHVGVDHSALHPGVSLPNRRWRV